MADMPIGHVVSLLVIAAIWAAAFRIGLRWGRACGVTEHGAVIALACVLPAAGLLFAVHVLATASLFTTRGWLTPEGTAPLFALVTYLAHRFVRALVEEVPHPDTQPVDSPPPEPLGKWWLPVGIVAATYAVFIIEALTRYPSGHDTLYYHLPQAVVWMQQRAIHLVDGLVSHSVPENGMIVPCLLAFAKLEGLFTVVHLPNAALCAVLVYALSRFLGAGRSAAVLAACVAMSIPVIIFQSVSGYIDLYAAVAWLSALLAVAWTSRAAHPCQRRGLLILAGLSAGVALGSKTTFIPLIALLGVIVVADDWMHRRAGQRKRSGIVSNAAVFSIATLACSGFWFVRGAVQAGNPVYPMTIKLGDTYLLPGVVGGELFPYRSWSHRIKHWATYPWRESKYGTGYTYGVDNGLGAAFATVVPIGLIAVAFGVLSRRPRNEAERWRVVSLTICFAGVVLLVTVYHEILRYVLPIAVLAAAVASLTLDRLIRTHPRSTRAVVTVSLALTAAVATFNPIHAFLGRWKDNVWSRAAYYQIPPLIDTLPPETRILSLAPGTDEYALLGRDFTNRVIIPKHWEIMTHADALSNSLLRAQRIDYIFTREPQPIDWPADLAVERIFDGRVDQPPWMSPKASLFRVLPPDTRAAGFSPRGLPPREAMPSSIATSRTTPPPSGQPPRRNPGHGLY